MEVPVGRNDGINAPANLNDPLNAFCVLYGTHRDFGPEQLAALYYSNADYRGQVEDVVRRLVRQGFVLASGSDALNDAARRRRPLP